MQTLGFIGYQLIYIQLPFLIAPLPESDLIRFSWSREVAMVGLYPYRDSVVGQFRSQEYYTRSILGEEDIFLLSGETFMRDTPYSFIRMVNGDYKFLNLYFQRSLDWSDISGGIYGLHTYRSPLMGYGNLTIPIKLKGAEGTIALSAYSNIWSISLNSNYFFIGTTRNKWLGYLKIGDLRFGSTYDKQFISYLCRPIDPIFLIMAEVAGRGSIKKREWEVTDWYIAPLYVLSLKSSIYCVISKKPAIGLKMNFFDIEIGEDSYLSVKTDFLRAFITYSKGDSIPRGGIGGKVSYPFYENKIVPGIEGSYHGDDLDLGLTLRVFEVELFWGMNDIPHGDFIWGLDVEFSL